MSTRRRTWYSNNKTFIKKIKDYIVPIVWFFLIVFLVYFCVKKPSTDVSSTENQVGISITKEADSLAYIFYQNSKKELEEWMSLYKWERIKVSEWRVKISNENLSFNIKKLWDLSYLKDWNFSLDSWDVWIDANSPISLDMKFAKLKISWDSHISISQNEVNSTIYVISWTVEVSNLVWKNTILSSKEEIEVARSDASNEKIDLSTKKKPISELFLKSDWFILNKWADYVWTWTTEESSTWTISTWETSTWNLNKPLISNWKSKYLTFSNLLDESNVSSSVISISWVYDTEEVWKIEVNWKTAVLSADVWTFKIEWIPVWAKENDLVFKVFNSDEDLKEKFVYTVYNDSWSELTNSSNNINNSWEWWANVFNVDGSKFSFTSPTAASTFTTYDDFVTIKWYVTAKNINKVEVNWLKLKSFNGTTWRYHATSDYWNLSSWTNVYEIKYYSWDNLIYKNYFTIIKKEWSSSKLNSSNWWKVNNVSVSTEKNNVSSESDSSTSLSY